MDDIKYNQSFLCYHKDKVVWLLFGLGMGQFITHTLLSGLNVWTATLWTSSMSLSAWLLSFFLCCHIRDNLSYNLSLKQFEKRAIDFENITFNGLPIHWSMKSAAQGYILDRDVFDMLYEGEHTNSVPHGSCTELLHIACYKYPREYFTEEFISKYAERLSWDDLATRWPEMNEHPVKILMDF